MKNRLLLVILLASGIFWIVRALPAHSPSADEVVARLEADPNATPLSGATDLVQAMLSTAWGQVDADRLKELSQLNQGYMAVAEAEREGAPDKAARIRSGTDHLLEHFLKELPLSLSVDLKGEQPVMSAAHIFEFAGDTGVMLLRLDAGPGRGGCSVMEINFEKHRETEPYPVLHYVPGATCWVLLRALHAPAGTHHTYVNFQTDSSKGQQLGRVTTKVAESGYLKLSIAEGETSSTTPVLIRFRHRENGSTYRPSSAVELYDQMHDIAGSMSVGRGNPDVLKVPNKFRGFYWCVPGSFQMSMPPGTWDLDIYKGIEYKNISSTITIASGQAVEKAFRMQRWIDMRSRGWWSGDDHIHARLMSDDDADRLFVWANATDLSVCNILRMGNHMRTFYEQRGFGPDFRVLRGNQALVPGQEDPRFFFGHSIGLNIREPVRDPARYGLNDWVADEVHRLGGLYGHAHVGADQFKISDDMTMLMPFGKSDFGEILQADVLGTATWYDFLNLGYQLTATAGSDMPYYSTMGEVRFYVYTGAKTLDVDAWFEGLRRGRTFVSNGPMLDLRVEEFLPGDTIRRDTDGMIPVHLVAEGEPGLSAPKSLRLIRFGKIIAEATSTDDQKGRLEITTTIPISYGGWVAAYALGHDGSQAHTTPIYLVREGFRPWDAYRASDLIADRINRIGVMEADFDQLQAQKDSGTMWELNDFNNKLLAVMPRNRERLREARAHYEQLQVKLGEELKQRH